MLAISHNTSGSFHTLVLSPWDSLYPSLSGRSRYNTGEVSSPELPPLPLLILPGDIAGWLVDFHALLLCYASDCNKMKICLPPSILSQSYLRDRC